jgi:hypothetical protein
LKLDPEQRLHGREVQVRPRRELQPEDHNIGFRD